MKHILLILATISSFFLRSQEVRPQGFDYPFEVLVFDLPVSKNGINYRLYVRPPLRAASEGEKPSSFYFLDPLRLFVPSAAMTSNYEFFNYHPAAYFVGIGYQNEADGIPKEANRTRDYTPTAFTPPNQDHYLAHNPVDYEGSGGCDAFLNVIEKEVIPFVEGRFDVSQDRVLIGKSTSGLAAVHALLTRPGLFNRYIIVSPSIWWDDWLYPRQERYVMKQVEQVSDAYDEETRAYFAVGEAEERLGLVTDLYVLTNGIKNQKKDNLKVKLEVLPGEQHEGVFPGAFMKGIVGIYAGEANRKKSASKISWD